MATNLELKVRLPPGAWAAVERAARETGADFIGDLEQGDTYFVVANGRLKLRETRATDGELNAELIAYHRPDEPGARWSGYQRVPVEGTEALRRALASTAGVLTVVRKRRRVWRWRRTRIHLDDVVGLGDFVELETVTDHAEDITAATELAELANRLGLAECETIASSYADLVAAQATEQVDKESRQS